MKQTKKCLWCGESFTPDHGNATYDSPECAAAAKAERQKTQRDPVSRLISILIRNHEILDAAFQSGKTELSKAEIEALQVDISICRFLQTPPEFEGKVLLDFGEIILSTEPNFQTFKIHTHDTNSGIQTR